MAWRRQYFDVNTDTGTWADTGAPFQGAVVQIGWNAATGDTGADLQIVLLPQPGDSGDGFLIYGDADCLGSDFVRAVAQPVFAADGFDTGVDQYAPYVAAGDRLRVKVVPGGAAVVGKLYVWTVD